MVTVIKCPSCQAMLIDHFGGMKHKTLPEPLITGVVVIGIVPKSCMAEILLRLLRSENLGQKFYLFD